MSIEVEKLCFYEVIDEVLAPTTMDLGTPCGSDVSRLYFNGLPWAGRGGFIYIYIYMYIYIDR